MNNHIRTRIAPSPTGACHIGLARTALFNYIFAKKSQGDFILRIEDTDKERSKPEYEKEIIDNLEWLGINWNEFYRQSERKDIYKKYIQKLLDQDLAYYCFCSSEELEAQKQYQLSLGQAPRYSGKCAGLSKVTVQKYLSERKPCVIRFRVPHKKVIFEDLIRGRLEFEAELFGDIVIAKNLAAPLYNLAVVIDDAEMKINYVIRGEDHLSNTPKQILLQKALGLSSPKYAHLPLILGQDKTKLSKRHQGAVSLSEYREQGYLPEAIINFIAFLGWNPGTEREIYSLASLVKEFSLERVQKGGAIFNLKRLDFLNGFYIRQKSLEKLTELCLPYLIKANLIKPLKPSFNNDAEELKLFKEKKPKFKIKDSKETVGLDYLKNIVKIYQERLKTLSEIAGLADFFFQEKLAYDKDLLKWRDMADKDVENCLEKLEKILQKIEPENFNKENLEKILMPEAEKTGDRGQLLWPLRVALSGKKASASPFEIAEILGKEKCLKRIKEAKDVI